MEKGLENLEKEHTGCVGHPVSVYTRTDGTTLAVSGGSGRAQSAIMAQAMLEDILALESGRAGSAPMEELGGVKSGLYSAAFTEAVRLAEAREGCPAPAYIRDAIRSLEADGQYLGKARTRMEADGVYPGSRAYRKILRAAYYVGTWKTQLEYICPPRNPDGGRRASVLQA